jgi:hypothetical protein
MAMSYVRFVVPGIDENSGCRQGLFAAMGGLSRTGALFEHEQRAYDDARRWFARHLPVPSRFSRSTRKNPKPVAICWFKASAGTHIANMRVLASILDAHGIHVQVLTTRQPGFVVYDDDFQVAAEPFAHARR